MIWLVVVGIAIGMLAVAFELRRDYRDMRVIDAHTGRDIHAGDTVTDPDGARITLLEVCPGIRSAWARVRINHGGETWVPLVVRWTHPMYMMQWVAFLPT